MSWTETPWIKPISIPEFNRVDKVLGRLSRIDTPEYQAILALEEGQGIKIPHSAQFPCTRKGNCSLTTLVYNVARRTRGRYETSHIGPRDVGHDGITCDHTSKGSRLKQEIVRGPDHIPEDCGHLAVVRFYGQKD